jgi:hypothetical protein
MEWIIILPFVVWIGWLFRRKETEIKKDVIRLGDKSWIINNEYVTFEEDTPLLRFKQQQEDDEHYRNFERARLEFEREQIFEEYLKTTSYIQKHPEVLKELVPKELIAVTEEYERYVRKCKNMGELMVLSKEEFLIKKKNPIYCCSFKLYLSIPMKCYTLYNEKTARYKGGNMQKQIEQEYINKWYA